MSFHSEPPPRGIRLATLGSVPVYLGWSWLVLGGVIIILIGPSNAQRFGALTGYSLAAAYAICLLLSVLAHEAAHAISAQAFGHRVHRVVADLWGGHTAFDASRSRPATAAVIAVVGPLTNGVIAGLAVTGSLIASSEVLIALLGGVAFVNGALAIFNLLPGLPLDGGQIVESLVWAATGSQSRARIVAGWAGRVLVIVLALVLIALPLLRGLSPSVTTALWAALIGAFLWSGASAAIAQGQALGTLAGLDVTAVLEPAAPIGADSPLSELTSLRALPIVVDSAGVPVGLINHEALQAVPPGSVSQTLVSAVTSPAPAGWTTELRAGQEALDLVEAFQASRSAIVVVTQEGALHAIARAERVNAALARN